MFRFFKFGPEVDFYGEIKQMTSLAAKAAKALKEGVTNPEQLTAAAAEVEKLEVESEDLKRLMARKIDATFIAPLDKEDLDHLNRKIHRISSGVHGVTKRLALYPIGMIRPDLPPFVAILERATHKLSEAIPDLNDKQQWYHLLSRIGDIHALEREADHHLRTAVATLFKECADQPIKVIQWKEIYEWMEEAVDRVDDLAEILERLVVKYA